MRCTGHTWLRLLAVALAAAGLSCSLERSAGVQAEATGDAKVEVKVVKYPDLIAAVKAHKGKVLVVDCWALT